MKKIMIVDDERDFCFFFKENLEASGDFAVTTCSEAAQAAGLAETWRPDIIFLDVMMPGVSGPEVVERLRTRPGTASIPVVFLTALTTREEIAERVPVAGNPPMLAKPVETERVLEMITAVSGSG